MESIKYIKKKNCGEDDESTYHALETDEATI